MTSRGLILLALAVVLVAIVVTGAITTLQNLSTVKAAEVRVCERLNVVRHTDNEAHWASWVVTVRYHLPAVLATSFHWTPLTYCSDAIDRPNSYLAPYPRTFQPATDLLRPPSDAVAR